MVTPGITTPPSGMLKNAIDHLHAEWNNKAAGVIPRRRRRRPGSRAPAADLRGTANGRRPQQVTLSLLTEFENFTIFTPGDYNASQATA